MPTITEQIDALLQELEQARPEYNQPENGVERCFIRDGILNETGYLNTYPKICFLLKETYGDFTDIVKAAEELNGLSKNMFGVMAQYRYVMQRSFLKELYDVQKLINLSPTVNDIGYVEIKKMTGNPRSTFDDLNKYAERDADFLRRQLAIIAPDIIYCAGTFEQCRYIYPSTYPSGLKPVDNRVYKISINANNDDKTTKDVYVIDYYHPSGCYGSYDDLYRLLLKAFHKIGGIEIRYDEKSIICKTDTGLPIPHQSIVPEHTQIELSVKQHNNSITYWTVNHNKMPDSRKNIINYTVEKKGDNNSVVSFDYVLNN